MKQPWHIVRSLIERPSQTIEKHGHKSQFSSRPLQMGFERAVGEMVRATGIRLHVCETSTLHIVRVCKDHKETWRMDNDYCTTLPGGLQPKYSIYVPLTDVGVGGTLEFMGPDGKAHKPSLKPGDGVVFPSTLLYRVRPVLKGERLYLKGHLLGQTIR